MDPWTQVMETRDCVDPTPLLILEVASYKFTPYCQPCTYPPRISKDSLEKQKFGSDIFDLLISSFLPLPPLLSSAAHFYLIRIRSAVC